MKIRQTKWIIGLALIAVGVGIVVATSLPKSMHYYVTVDELMNKKQEYVGKELKVAGKVVQGSIQKSERDLLWDFQVENANQVITINYQGAMPDTFKEGAEVVITGKVDSKGIIQASNVLAKCASRYEERLTPGYDTAPRKTP